MSFLKDLTEEDYKVLAEQIETLSQQDENEIFKIIGNSLNREGYSVADDAEPGILQPKMMIDFPNRRIDPLKALEFANSPFKIKKVDARKTGKSFWKKFEKKIKKEICSNESIKAIITGNGTLVDYLKAGIPILLTALGITAVNPTMLAVIIAVFALIVKVGYKTYCDIE